MCNYMYLRWPVNRFLLLYLQQLWSRVEKKNKKTVGRTRVYPPPVFAYQVSACTDRAKEGLLWLWGAQTITFLFSLRVWEVDTYPIHLTSPHFHIGSIWNDETRGLHLPSHADSFYPQSPFSQKTIIYQFCLFGRIQPNNGWHSSKKKPNNGWPCVGFSTTN